MGVSGTVGKTTLSVEQLAKHKHTGMTVNNVGANGLPAQPQSPTRLPEQGIGYTGDSQPHTHTLSGSSGSASTLPPYYALALIMRIA